MQLPVGPEGLLARRRIAALVALPATLIVFGVVIFFLTLDTTVSDTSLLPAVLAYAVPGCLAGMGMAILFWRGIPTAAVSKPIFGRFMPLAVLPETSAVFGLVVAFFLLGAREPPTGSLPYSEPTTWLTSALSMAGGIGGPLDAWLAASSWDFRTLETWPRVLSSSTRGSFVSFVALGLTMVVLGEWLVALLLIAYFGGVSLVALAATARARRKRKRQ